MIWVISRHLQLGRGVCRRRPRPVNPIGVYRECYTSLRPKYGKGGMQQDQWIVSSGPGDRDLTHSVTSCFRTASGYQRNHYYSVTGTMRFY